MKNLGTPQDKQEILHRLQTIEPTSPRLWGRMSAHQMVCHLSDGFRMYMNLKPVPPAAVAVPRGLMKFVALWVPIPWPHGFKAAPELDQEVGGTPPARFEADLCELRELMERFTQQPRKFQWQPHPHFGMLADHEWMRLGYLHCDHHLRQFGA